MDYSKEKYTDEEWEKFHRMANENKSSNLTLKEKMMTSLSTRFKTTFIGSIDIFERNFGHLWGQGKKLDELTENEKKWRSHWMGVREELLDNGNLQSRLAQKDLEGVDMIKAEIYKYEWRKG